MNGLFIFLIVLTVSTFVYMISKKGMEHSENMERMKHGYPLLDGSVSNKQSFFTENNEN